MRQRVIIGVAAAVVLAACGGGDDDAGSEPTTEQVEESTEEPVEESVDEPTADSADEPTDEPADEPDADGGDDGDGGDGDDGETVEIDSLSDAPPECMDLFVDYLQDIEPFVESVDWEQATLTDMEAIGTEFDVRSGDFDDESRRLGCDQFTFDDDEAAFDEMIEIARREAPGTVGFFEFISTFRDAVGGLDDDGGDGAGGSDSGTPETCDEAVAAIEGLVEQYDTINDVPGAEVARVIGIVSSLTTVCTFAELDEIYQRQDIADFLG